MGVYFPSIIMAQLIFSLSTQKTFALPLEEAVVTLGRASDNTAQIDEGSISRHHARLTRTPNNDSGVWMIEDLNTVNGIRRNGVKITGPVLLVDGDKLEFGLVSAEYRTTLPPVPAQAVLPPAPSAVDPDRPLKETVTIPSDPLRILGGVYKLGTILGHGLGFTSYRARNTKIGRDVTVKLINAAALPAPEARELLTQAVHRLQVHPHSNIVATLAVEANEKQIFLVFEALGGLSLLDVLRRRRVLAVRECVYLLAQVASALDHARAHGLPDLDMHPATMLFATALPGAGEAFDESLLDKPLDLWPPFFLKLAPVLPEPQIAVDDPGDEPATVFQTTTVTNRDHESGGIVFILSALLCEMLGHPLSHGVIGLNAKPPRIISLGEGGNLVLSQGLMQSSAFRNGGEFYAALARAVGVSAAG